MLWTDCMTKQRQVFSGNMPGGTGDGPFLEAESVAGGVLMVLKERGGSVPTGIGSAGSAGGINYSPGDEACGEEVYFCRLARQHGFKIWTQAQQFAGHFRTTDETAMSCTLLRGH